jgi:hypothetical protein
MKLPGWILKYERGLNNTTEVFLEDDGMIKVNKVMIIKD